MHGRVFVAGVRMSIVFDQQIDVVEEEAVDGRVVDERFDEADVLQSGAIEELRAQLFDHVNGERSTLES